MFNGQPGDPRSFDLLDDLLEQQCYRLAYWRVAPDEINYRRFFDVNDLAALSMEREEVFEAAHGLVLRLLAEGKVDGLRIDHPDGLYDPRSTSAGSRSTTSWRWPAGPSRPSPARTASDWEDVEGPLRDRIAARDWTSRAARCGRPLYVVAEKILGADEPLVETWPVHGTSGYDFLNQVNGLFVDAPTPRAFTRLYTRLGPGRLAVRRAGLPQEAADPAGLALQRAAHADQPARPAGAEDAGARGTSPSTRCGRRCGQ